MTKTADDRPAGERLTSLHIRQAIGNDRASVGWLVARFTPLLLCQAQQRMPPSLRRFCDSDDVVSDVWMVVLAALPRLEPANGSFSRGLLRFASTVLIRRLRDLLEKHVVAKPSLASMEEAGPSNLPADTRGVVSHVVAEEHKSQVWSCLNELPPQDREILVLRGIEGYSHKEVAARVGLTLDNVTVRYHRALKRLREFMPASVFDDLEEG
jgi:RNA polymerase sigma-70 factor (ECF subfamily)